MKKTEFEKEISRMFQDSRVAVDEEKKRQTFCLLAGVIAEQKLVPRMSFPERIRTQLYFVEWRILLAQLLCMLLSAAVYVRADLPWIQAAPYLPAGIASVLSGMLLVLACNREEASGIAAACGASHGFVRGRTAGVPCSARRIAGKAYAGGGGCHGAVSDGALSADRLCGVRGSADRVWAQKQFYTAGSRLRDGSHHRQRRHAARAL